ncbi:MAG: isoprenylcysteine carboxylmethyltransferase family protein [Acidobacteria bacterium]|nr:MAG: isoprenylcysteine carboxylmethyltransferase family protein [Acidobacteriota bacterium]
MRETSAPWWRGAHGEWYFLAQLALTAVLFLGPRTLSGLPEWPAHLARAFLFAGTALMIGGVGLLIAGLLQLGSALTPLPYPRSHARLVRTGPYRIVRHPMYAGGILLAYGWALVVHGWLTLVYATVILIFLDIKSRREEQWLTEKFSDYPDYRARVHKLIPFVY